MIHGICFSSEYRKKKRKEEHSSRSSSYQSGGSARCRICETGADNTISHLISTCQGLAVERKKILADFSKLCTINKNDIFFEDPLPLFYKISRDFCHFKDYTRIRLLKQL